MNNGNINKKQLDGKFEQQFKNKFENAQFTPPAHLWEQIDAALDAKPWYKRPLFYWTSGLVAALLLVVMFWFTLVYDNSNYDNSNSATTSANSDTKKIENTIGANENTETTSISQKTVSNTTEVNTIEKNPVQRNELVADSDTKVNQIGNSTTSINDKSNVAISIIPKNKDKDNKTDVTSDKIILLENTALAAIDFKEIDWSKYLPIGNPYFENEVIVKVDSTNEAIAKNQNSQNPIENLKKASGIAIIFGVNHTQGTYKPSFRTDSLYSGLTVIEAYRSNLADTLTQMNISGTYQQTGFDIALAFGKNQRWSINTGIGVGKANYSFGSSNYTLFGGNDIPNDQQPLIAHYNNQVEVNYEWIQIPIAIGYQFGESKAKKFSGFAQLGTAIEFLNSYSYTSADPQFTYALGTHRTTNTNVWTQVGVNYHITNRFTLWGGGTYKSSLSSLINENGVTFSSQSYGWQVGTRFTIFKSGK
jgi:hypothetical protein